MKKIGLFILLCLYAVGIIGGVGYTLYCRAWFIAACVIALGGMAFPTAKRFYKELFDKK